MSDDELERLERAHSIRADYPEEMHFVGGPYCGAFLYPHEEKISDVFTHGKGTTPRGLPWTFMPVEHDMVVMIGPFGNAVHRQRDERYWDFVGWYETDEIQDPD